MDTVVTVLPLRRIEIRNQEQAVSVRLSLVQLVLVSLSGMVENRSISGEMVENNETLSEKITVSHQKETEQGLGFVVVRVVELENESGSIAGVG